MNNKLKALVFPVIALSIFTVGDVVSASEVTGGLSTSITSSITSTVDGVVMSAPVASPETGVYSSAQNISLSSGDSISIHYTIDGALPTCTTGTAYTGAISVGSSAVIQAISCYPGDRASTVASFSYAISIPVPASSGVSASVGASSGGGAGGGWSGSPVFPTASYMPVQSAVVVQAPAKVLGANVYNFTRRLSLGMKGNDVTELQQFLLKAGVYKGPITGYFGALTKTGVKSLQKANKLSQEGVVGPLTLSLLNRGLNLNTPEVASTTITTPKSNLTSSQIQAIVGLLQTFGANQTTVSNVKMALGA